MEQMGTGPLQGHERTILLVVAVLGAFGLNGVFLYVLLARPDLLQAALRDPIAWVLMIEAFLVTGVFGWWLARKRRQRPGGVVFILLSLLGGIAFSLPLVILAADRDRRRSL
jgi:hypothetical protein